MPAGPICVEHLDLVTLAGALGVACLLGAWLLHLLAGSRSLLRLALGLAVVGRLIALGTLGTAALVVALFTNY